MLTEAPALRGAATRDAHYVVAGVRVSSASLEDIVSACTEPQKSGTPPVTVACANLHCLVVAAQDAEFSQALATSTFVTADGAPLVWAGQLCHGTAGPRITGSDVFAAVMERLDRQRGSVMLVGSTPTVLERMFARAAVEYPHVAVGLLSPPFGAITTEDNAKIVRAINAFSPDVVWVGMTAPKQEKWTAENAAALDVGAVISIGAVFDFYARTVSRAPVWMRRAGLEWLYRLLREPRRLWRRYLVSGPLFVSLVWRDRQTRRVG